MVQQLILENFVEKKVASLLKSKTPHVGLIVGQLSEGKDFVLHLAKCPEKVDEVEVEVEFSGSGSEDGELPTKSITKTRSKKEENIVDSIDVKWVAEHSRQVTRMLTGGLSIIGVYSFCSPNELSKIQNTLRQCLVSVRRKCENNKFIRNTISHNNRYIMNICSVTGKLTCSTVDISDEQLLTKTVTPKFQAFYSNWHHFNCFVDVDVHALIPHKESNKTHQKVTIACQNEIENIWNSHAAIDFKIIQEEQPISEKNQKKGSKKEVKEITFFKKQNKSNGAVNRISSNEVNSEIKFIGSVSAKAVVNQKANYGDAVQALKVDIIRSIMSRVELLCEEAEINNFCQVMSEWSLMSPTRVFANDNEIAFSDYAFKDETKDETINRFADLLGFSPVIEDLVYSEKSPEISDVSMILRGEKLVDSDVASEKSSVCPEEPSNWKLIASCAVAIIAILFSFLSLLFRH